MKVLHLTLKKKWFNLILSGAKTEEYREIKPYWYKRFLNFYDVIKFKNGYSKDCPQFIIKLESISVDFGKVEWGAPENKAVYILKLGDLINTHHTTGKVNN